ncbi:hypothetical protein [Parachitinimonas caeni]|uniref:Transcriptional regulator n=1 Tax=Parachitinimonas caeni TaxID=3031301 RepID=A0ABT7E1W2_9NEIS|nr:hypothetical protein [Parachitinimonas caeni]MDK2126239.1 hypothetical protein [Parachitinimonas caeni]
MDTQNHPNNARLRELIAAAGLTQQQALALFNQGQVRPYSIDAWKRYLSAPDSKRWRLFPADLLPHAEKTLKTRKGDKG